MAATRKGVTTTKPRKPGRPSTFSRAMADRICRELAGGKPLTEICRADGMPGICTVFRWLDSGRKSKAHAEFREAYARAREIAAHVLVGEILEIADDGRNDWVERQGRNGETYIALNEEAVQRSRLRVDTRKWAASKLLPKAYGDKVTTEISGPDGGKVPVEVTHEVSDRLAKGLAALRSKLPT